MKLFAMTLASLSMLACAPALADPARLREDVRTVAPALEKYERDTLLGNVWTRPGLSLRDRSIVTLSALIARNQTVEMFNYLNVALDNGVTPAEVSEIITHLAFYSGWGNAMSAVAVAKDVDLPLDFRTKEYLGDCLRIGGANAQVEIYRRAGRHDPT